jgi:hypothetical protein
MVIGMFLKTFVLKTIKLFVRIIYIPNNFGNAQAVP